MKIYDSWLISGLTFLTLIINVSFNVPPDCSKLKNGKFFYYLKPTNSKIYVERIDSLQIETNSIHKVLSRSKIVWKKSCSYIMYVNALSKTKLNASDSLLSTMPVTVDIIDVNREFYIFSGKITISKKPYEFRDTIYIRN